MFLEKRNRRLRKSNAIRELVQENRLHVSDFVAPLFVIEGQNKKALESEFREWINAIDSEYKNYEVLYIKKIDTTHEDVSLDI